MAGSVRLYRCEVCHYYTRNEPDCHDCHTQACPYNIGFSKYPCIMVRDVIENEEGEILSSTPERPLYPKNE